MLGERVGYHCVADRAGGCHRDGECGISELFADVWIVETRRCTLTPWQLPRIAYTCTHSNVQDQKRNVFSLIRSLTSDLITIRLNQLPGWSAEVPFAVVGAMVPWKRTQGFAHTRAHRHWRSSDSIPALALSGWRYMERSGRHLLRVSRKHRESERARKQQQGATGLPCGALLEGGSIPLTL
jgi:hypothetical protein